MQEVTPSNLPDDSSQDYCKYDIKRRKLATNQPLDHHSKHQRKLRERFDRAMHKHSLLSQKLNSFTLQMKSEEIEKTPMTIRQQLDDLLGEENQRMPRTDGLEPNQNDYLDNQIEILRKDIDELKLNLEEINNYSQEQSRMNVSSYNLSEITKSSSSKLALRTKNSDLQFVLTISRSNITHDADDTKVLSEQILKQMTRSISNRHVDVLTDVENETPMEGKELIDSNIPLEFTQKIRLSNNIVRWLRGPIKLIFNGTMYVFDVCAQGTRISDTALQAVKQGLDRQKGTTTGQHMNKTVLKPAFAEITSDWIFEGANVDRGFNSVSVWMRDPQGRRILVKNQGHPLCAANEWLVYILGSILGLPVNEVQIGIYQNNLVTLHTDVAHENEKTMTFMELPKQTRKKLLTDPTMGFMDLLDHIVQNVDRNQRNILITMPNATDANDDPEKMRIHLIDHASCFGMGKLSIISLIACKFHSNHLSVVKFDPTDEARKFEQYLNRLPIVDRRLIRKILHRFATITDDQFDSWLIEVKELLSHSQYNRMRSVLYRQRDIAKDYISQWSVYSSVKLNDTNQIKSEINEPVTFF